MRRSKLETYIDILKVLLLKGPAKLTQIKYKVNVSYTTLKEQIDFLTKAGLVETRKIDRINVVYALTQRGNNVLIYFHQPKQELPLIE